MQPQIQNLVLLGSLALLSSCFRSYEIDLSKDVDGEDADASILLLLDSGFYPPPSEVDEPSLLGYWEGNFQIPVYSLEGTSYYTGPAAFEFTDTGVAISLMGTEMVKASYVVDNDQIPQRLDIEILPTWMGTDLNYNFPAIYKIEDSVLTLNLSFSSMRPTSFSVEGEQPFVLFEVAKKQ